MIELREAEVASFRTSGEFDAEWYCKQYPDVKLVGMDPAEHYLRFGKMLGRQPSAEVGVKNAVTYEPQAPSRRCSHRDPFEYFMAPTTAIEAVGGFSMSRLMYYIWTIRADLRLAFDIRTVEGMRGFCVWFVESFEGEYGFTQDMQSAEVLGKLAKQDEHVGAKARRIIGERAHRAQASLGSFEAGGVNLIGYAKGDLGMGGQVRSAANSLMAARVPFDVVNVMAAGSSNGDASIESWISQQQRFQTNIFHINADMFPLECLRYGRGRRNIGHWAWELPHCPPEFESAIEVVDEIWTVSEFTARAFRERARVPVMCMPQSIDVPHLSSTTYTKRLFGLPNGRFTFLFTFDAASLIDRKNPIDVVRAFNLAFPKGNEKVHLVVKAMNGERGGPLWEALLHTIGDSPRITMIDSRLTQVETLGLTVACDAFVSLHRSEGFGRCMAEAMAYGKPVIATNFSGSCDFAKEATACLVDYELVPVPADSYPYASGQTWAQPDVQHAAWTMKRVLEDERYRIQKAEAGQHFIRDNFNDKVVGQRYSRRLEELQREEGLRPSETRKWKSKSGEQRRTVLFTITSKNYISYARTVLKSVASHHPEYELVLGLADEVDGIDVDAEPFTIVTARELGIPNFLDMTLRYDVLEFNTAIKPFMFRWLLANSGADKIIYFDPDLFLYRRLDEMTAHLDDGASAVLTPHITEPLPSDGYSPDDHAILRSGVFNLGFIAIRRCDESVKFVEWWSDKLQTKCTVDLSRGLFTDQRWCDYAPCFLPNLRVLHDVGYNVAYWNLPQRTITNLDGEHFVNDRPLVFFHFSGINPTKSRTVSKHQDRLRHEDLGEDCARLFEAYCAILLENGWEAMLRCPYAYDQLDKLAVRPVMRQLYRELNPRPRDFEDVSAAKRYLLEICLRPVDRLQDTDSRDITELMLYIYQLRRDLQDAFSLSSSDGRKRFRDWFTSAGPREYQLVPEIVDAI